MCGIAGYWSKPGASDRMSLLDSALLSLKQRGPDDHGAECWQARWGEVGLGHTRLSIIDLSAGGHQPMHSADGRYSIVFNGEIYNYRELRKELVGMGHSFRTQSDTEVLLTAWATWGEGCLLKLVGMFAFVVLDRSAGTLTCVRDAFGIKPFFFSDQTEGFCFASELPAAVLLRGQGAELNLQRAYDYLAHGDYDSTDETFVAGIWQLEPGTLFVLDLESGRLGDARRWWVPQVMPVSKLSLTDAASQLRRLFLDGVSQHLRRR